MHIYIHTIKYIYIHTSGVIEGNEENTNELLGSFTL